MNNTNSNNKLMTPSANSDGTHLIRGWQSERLSPNMHNLLDDDNAVNKRLIGITRKYMTAHHKHTS